MEKKNFHREINLINMGIYALYNVTFEILWSLPDVCARVCVCEDVTCEI
jgi:hypothetical protein